MSEVVEQRHRKRTNAPTLESKPTGFLTETLRRSREACAKHVAFDTVFDVSNTVKASNAQTAIILIFACHFAVKLEIY